MTDTHDTAASYAGLRLERRGHTAVVTLTNPPAHTWTADSLAALTRLVGDLNRDREIYALVITGDGEKFFSAGADLKLFADGQLPCAGGTQWLSWAIGESWAKRMVLLGERVDAETALRIGLADELVPKGGALAKALQWAERVQAQSPTSVTACKRLIQGARTASPQSQLAAEREAFVGLFETEDQREGVQAFLGKRSPQWRNA